MEKEIKAPRFNYNPLAIAISAKKKEALRIGYIEAAQQGFYLNSLEAGVPAQAISTYLLDKLNCKDADTTCESFRFLLEEGDRTAYAILLPYLLSSENRDEFEQIIRERFFGIERFVKQGKNLYNFLHYVEERKEPIVWINDLEKGIIGWDMGQLIGLVRAAHEKGYINKKQAWSYIEEARKQCNESFCYPTEIDKSYLIGQAMKLDKIEDWDRLIWYYLQISHSRE